MKKILYLPIETIAREFDARMLITHQALLRGYAVITGQKENVYKAANIIGQGIYFYKSHDSGNFPKNKTEDLKYITLDEEGLVFVDDNEYLRNSKPYELDHLDIVFTWGSYQQKLLIKANPELKNKVIPVGNSRFDLLRPEFKPVFGQISEKIRNKWEDYVIINTRFAPGNFSRLYGCSYVESRKHQYNVFIGRNPTEAEFDFLEQESQYYEELFIQYVEMLKSISPKFPDINFILRPHPSEDILNWKEALRGLKNVHVIFEGTAIDWILGALMVIHTGCTTGIEAWALKKPVIAYNPNKKTGIEPPLPNKFGIKVDTPDGLFRIIDDAINGKLKKQDNKQINVLHSYIESIKGEYSVVRFLDALDKTFRLSSLDDAVFLDMSGMESVKRAFKIKVLKFLSKYQPVIKKYTGGKINEFIYNRFKKYPGLMTQFKKFPVLNKKDIKNKLNIYDKILKNGQFSDYITKKIATDTYFILKK